MAELILPYKEARGLIKEADVLLFRYPPRQHWYSLPSAGWFIATYGGGIHSHVALASWQDGRLNCVEFREWRGGRSVVLSSQVKQNPGRIDVFRALPTVENFSVVKNEQSGLLYVDSHKKCLNNKVAKNITAEMYQLTGMPYGWKIIWQLGLAYLPGFRLAKKNIKDDEATEIYVCSTAVAFCYRKHFADPVPYMSDSSTKPADLTRSPLFQYLFTIGEP